MTPKNIYSEKVYLWKTTHKMNAFIAFLINERDALVKQCIERAIKICRAGNEGCLANMLKAMNRFRSEAEKRFSEMCLLNEVFGFLNPHTLFRSDSIKIDTGKFEKMYAEDVNFTELKLEIARCNRLVQSSGFTFKNDATALDVLQWLSKHRLCESTPYLFMSLKLYLTVAVSIASCKRSFSKLKLIKSYL